MLPGQRDSAFPQPLEEGALGKKYKTTKIVSTRVLNAIYKHSWVQWNQTPCRIKQITDHRVTLIISLTGNIEKPETLRVSTRVRPKREIVPLLHKNDTALIQNPKDPMGRHFIAMITKVGAQIIEFNWVAEDATEFPDRIDMREPSQLSLMERVLPIFSPEFYSKMEKAYGAKISAKVDGKRKKFIAFNLTRILRT